MISTIEVSIEDAEGEAHEYRITHIPGTKALKLSNRLLGMLSGTAGLMFQDVDPSALGGAAGNAVSMLSKAIISEGDEKFWMRLLDQVIRDGSKMYGPSASTRFDLAYAGNLVEFFEVVYHVLDHNFGKSIRGAIKKGIARLEAGQDGPLSGILASLTKGLTPPGNDESS